MLVHLRVKKWSQFTDSSKIKIFIEKPPEYCLKRSQISLMSSDNYIRMSGKGSFTFELFLHSKIDSDTILRINENDIEIQANKVTISEWPYLEAQIDNDSIF